MEELRQDKFAKCQRPKYKGREEGEEDRDLIGQLFSPHDALAGVNQQARFLATMAARKGFVSSNLSLYSAGCHSNPSNLQFPIPRSRMPEDSTLPPAPPQLILGQGRGGGSLCDTGAWSDF